MNSFKEMFPLARMFPLAVMHTPHRRYLTEFWNFRYGLRVKRKENYLYIAKCNNIKYNSELK